MASYRLSETAKEDLIRIHQFGVLKFGVAQADKYFYAFFGQFEIIAKQPYLFQPVDYIQPGYRRCVCGVDSIYYRIVETTVEIMSIIGRQDTEKVEKTSL
ncbi:type II toxin-antitoxin system RelE/ParE family toxin [Leadbetterella sp. DM7]|uniref:type II toxin-antitoxin system RelE/ParE family toxin n=1 Tax=Leadbetterella sp. DM7 TaxID=3235085 RepID=UPI00349EAB35